MRAGTAVFGIGPQTLSELDIEQLRRQVERGLAATPEVSPFSLLIVGGVIDPNELHWPFNHMQPADARDWPAILAWADMVAETFSFGKAAGDARNPRTELQQTPR